MAGSDFLDLDPSTAPSRGRTAWLAQRLRAAIADGTLPPGTRLPAGRALAEELPLARGTVVEAYRRLGEEGLLVTNRGGGTTVRYATPSHLMAPNATGLAVRTAAAQVRAATRCGRIPRAHRPPRPARPWPRASGRPRW
ncbi:GntR family transcriptional regulator [Nocardiopsis listeri]|uniref:GntR family transcriptional regulator n=1 Tax=Nocardiopsis listeri TaxID=53440 RepID=UPI000835A278|nr:winged helix-turn-helix domain-containing protein [Nocardiopsis listeri]